MIGAILEATLRLAVEWGWVVAPIILALVFYELWMYYIRSRFFRKMEWVLLRLVAPQEVLKTPLAMEQVFAVMHSIFVPPTFQEKYFQGRVQEWFSIELVSIGGAISFYIRTPRQFRNITEAALYSQYPEIEIHEAEDYISQVPEHLPTESLEIFGSEFKMLRGNAYPLRTYIEFAFETKEREEQVDPIAELVESLGRMREGEHYWLQFIIQPADNKWQEEGVKIVDEFMGRTEKGKSKKGHELLIDEVGAYLREFPQAPFVQLGSEETAKKDEKPKQYRFPSSYENAIIEAITRNISKVGFNSMIRGVYIAPKELFEIPRYFSVIGYLRQLSSQNLNGLKPDKITSAPPPFKKMKVRFAKKSLLFRYRNRLVPKKPFILSTETLATLFHFPSTTVTTPTMPRVEMKKGETPATLPTT